MELYKPPDFNPQMEVLGTERVVTDIDEVDAYWERIESGGVFAMSGAEVDPDDDGKGVWM